MKKSYIALIQKNKVVTNIIEIYAIYIVMRFPIVFATGLDFTLGIGYLQILSYDNFGYDFHWIFVVARILFSIMLIIFSYQEIKLENKKWKYYVMYILYGIISATDMFLLHIFSMLVHQ